MIYEWDETKRAANLKKHGLDFADADLVLESEYVLIVDSPRKGEVRQQAFAFDRAVGRVRSWRRTLPYREFPPGQAGGAGEISCVARKKKLRR